MRRKQEVNWAFLILILCALLGPSIGVFLWRMFDVMNESTIQFVAGATFTALVFGVATLCWTGVVMAYSRLRRTEEHEDDYREMALIEQVRSQYTKDKSPPVTVQVAPGIPTSGNYPPVYTPPQLDFQNGGVEIG